MNAKQKRTALKIALAGIFAGLLLRFFVVDILIVHGKSMEPFIKDHDVIFVNRLSYGLAVPFGSSLFFSWNEPVSGECIIYMYNNNMVVKRCAACSGESLEYSSNKGYTLTTNGKSYSLSYEQYRLMNNIEKVPEGMILAIGDNTEVSLDSRSYGFVPVRNVIGKVLCR